MATESPPGTHEAIGPKNQHLRTKGGAAPNQPELDAANKRIAALERQLMLAGTHLKNLATENDQLARKVEENAARRAELENEIMSIRKQSKTNTDRETEEPNGELGSVDGRRYRQVGGEDLGQLDDQLRVLQEELASARAREVATEQVYAVEKQKADAELSSSRTRLLELERNAASAVKEAAERESSLREWATALEIKLNASAEIATTATGEGALQARVRQLEEELAETEVTLEQLSESHQEELSQLVATYKRAHEEDVTTIRKQQLQSDQTAEHLRTDLVSAQEEIRRLNDSLAESDKIRRGADSMEITLRTLQEANIAAEAEIKELKATNEKLEATLTKMSSEFSERRLTSEEDAGNEKQRIAVADLQALVDSQSVRVQDLSEQLSASQAEANSLKSNARLLEQTAEENICRRIAAELDSILSKNELPETERNDWPETLRDIFGRVHETFVSIGPDQRETEQKTQEAIRAACASLEAEHKEAMNEYQDKLDRITQDRNTLRSEHHALIGKVNAMKATLTPKLQADQEEAKLLRSHIAQLTDQNRSLGEQYEAARNELEVLRGESNKMNRELERLRAHLLEAHEASDQDALAREEMTTDLSARAQRAESELAKWKDAMAQREAEIRMTDARRNEIEAEYTTLKYDLQMARRENEELGTNLQNLQCVLDEFEAAKESDIAGALETLRQELEKSTRMCIFYQSKAEHAETEWKKLESELPSAKQLQNEVREKNALIGKLRHEAILLNDHLAEAMRRMKDETAEYSVDRRLITNLFVQYFNAPRADRKRWDILKLMSSMLQFTDEQNEQVGLKPITGNWIGPGGAGGVISSPVRTQSQTPIGPGTEESFTDKWISFLLSESSDRQTSNDSLKI